MKNTLMLAVAALAVAGCADDAPEAVYTPPVGEAEVVTPPADDAEMDTTLADEIMLDDDALDDAVLDDATMTEGETLTDDGL